MDNYSTPPIQELFTVTAISAKTGLSRSKIYQLIQAGTLPSIKIDGSRRIKRKDFEAWIDELGSETV